MNEDHDGGDGHGDDQVLRLGKEEREKQGKGDIHRSSLFWWSRHLESVITFSIDSRTIKGVKLIVKCDYQSATRFSNPLHMHLDSSEC